MSSSPPDDIAANSDPPSPVIRHTIQPLTGRSSIGEQPSEPVRRQAVSHRSDLDVGHLRSIAIVGSAVEGQRRARACAKKIDIDAIADDDP